MARKSKIGTLLTTLILLWVGFALLQWTDEIKAFVKTFQLAREPQKMVILNRPIQDLIEACRNQIPPGSSLLYLCPGSYYYFKLTYYLYPVVVEYIKNPKPLSNSRFVQSFDYLAITIAPQGFFDENQSQAWTRLPQAGGSSRLRPIFQSQNSTLFRITKDEPENAQ